ncbi:TipJ family phage tail tip protein [Leclercia adecarboxylata]|uniref:TipJ family phage tail tip protein n=1 Tax=Leclercia adecarboxylata TaxID=83655 RepID=UPI001F062E90|nr:DUF1983 domain-containing protein [Leclercia adecarboxylata]MCH2683573.1 DUF1983 domain-containing protein [Leclercia adecarboxylata]
MDMTITGAKGGGGSSDKGGKRGTEISSVAYMKLLLALTEGEAAGGFTGKEIYLDGTPLLDDNGAENFPGVTWEWRSGTADQAYIQGFPSVENELNVGIELKYGTPWVKSINNTQLSAVRLRLKFPNGLYALRDSGGKNGYQVEYAVDISTDGSTYVEYGRDEADGIANTGYERSYRINLPPATSGWQIRVRRLTSNSNDGRHADTTRIESMTEIVDAKLRYPHTALLFIQFDAKLFDGRTPTVTVKMKGIICRVPANYDPNTRTYTGNWDGTFKWAWTNNPAWVFYDIITRARYGLGQRITQNLVDKWTLYQIGQYCDVQVSDGAGGKEARHLCDLYISQRTDAWTVLMDLASIFRGMISWSNNLLSVDADMPRELDPDFVFNKSNIVGAFNFSSTSEKTNYSAAIVTYSNPANGYADDQASAHVQRISARFGFNTLEKTAVGCTRASEAQRAGLWAIETNDDDNAVEFKTGMEGRIPRVGKIIGINNAPLAGRNNGGRVAAASGTKITLDRIVAAKAGDALIINLPTGRAESRKVVSVSGRAVTVDRAYSTTPNAESGWVLDQADLAIQLFRVKRIAINSDDTVTINGLPFNPTKFARIDDGAIVEERPVTVVPPRGQAAPANVTISSAYRVEQGIGITTLIATWDSMASAIAYEAQWRQNNGDWINVPRTGNTRFEVDGIYTGRYVVRVRAINALDIASVWSTSTEVQLTGKVGQPPAPINLRTTPLVWGCQIDWDFPAGTADTMQTEVHYATDAAGSSPLLLSDIPYPQHSYQQMGLRAGTEFWYRARLIDRIGNKSPWTAWIIGGSSSSASDYLPELDNQIKQTETYEKLTSEMADLSDDIQSARDDISKVSTESAATKAGLAQEVTDRKKAITDEAAARGQALLTEKNARVADISNVNQTIQTTTESLAQQIGQISAGTGSQFDPAKIWYFDSTVEGWSGNGTPTIVDGWIRPANHATDPWVQSPGSLGVNSSSYRFVKLRIRKFGAPGWAGQLRWRGTGGFNDTNMVTVAEPAYDANGIATLEFDNIPWLTEATMNQFRLDLSTRQDATNYYLIDWVALGRPTPGAGMAALQAETTARVQGDQAEATARETLAAQIRGGYAGNDPSKLASGLLYTERQARITAQEAEVTARTALEATVNANKASVTQELATLTTEQEAQATTLSGLQTTVGKNTGDIMRIDKAVADNNKAQTTALAAVKATTDQNTADISSEITARTDGDSALGRRIDSLKVDVDGNTASRDAGIVGSVSNALANFMAFSDQRVTFAVSETKTMAEITETRKTAADATSAVAEQVTTLKSTVEQNGQTNAAAITRIDKAAADLKSATASSIQEVKAEIGDTNAAVQTTSEAVADINGKLSAQWGVKVQVEANGVKRIAGIQLGIDGTGASNFLISADTFAVYNPTTNGQELVFASTGGQMFMRSVFIQDGSIDNGKIGNYIQSSNWDGTGNVGWHINKSGYATFNGVTVRGTIYATNGEFRGTVYATDGDFKGTVYANKIVGDVVNMFSFPGGRYRGDPGKQQDFYRQVTWAGGVPYDVTIAVPTFVVWNESDSYNAAMEAYVNINGRNITVAPLGLRLSYAGPNNSQRQVNCYVPVTASLDIPANSGPVAIRVGLRGIANGEAFMDMQPSMVLITKRNTPNFSGYSGN